MDTINANDGDGSSHLAAAVLEEDSSSKFAGDPHLGAMEMPVTACGTRFSRCVLETGCTRTMIAEKALSEMSNRPKLIDEAVPARFITAGSTPLDVRCEVELDIKIG